MIVDRMVHLALCGYAVSVVNYLIQCMVKGSMDTSLVRHFVHEVSMLQAGKGAVWWMEGSVVDGG